MSHNPLRPERFSAGRRAFLRRSGAVVLAAAPVAAWARTSECRSLSFVHTHTGEILDCTYYQGGYAPTQLARVNHFLRDFRTGEVHRIDPGVLDILFGLRTRTGCDEPFHVISGYRSPRTNAMLRRRSAGVAAHSLHMRGQAVDVRLPGVPTKRLQELALTLQRGGVGYYPKSDFVHLDTGRVRFW